MNYDIFKEIRLRKRRIWYLFRIDPLIHSLILSLFLLLRSDASRDCRYVCHSKYFEHLAERHSSRLPFAHELIDKIHDRPQHNVPLTPVSWSSMANLTKETWHSSPQDKTPRRPCEEMCDSTLGTPIIIGVKTKRSRQSGSSWWTKVRGSH